MPLGEYWVRFAQTMSQPPQARREDASETAATSDDPSVRRGWSNPEVVVVEFEVTRVDGLVPVRLYTPRNGLDPSAPTLVWVHGGGFVGGDLDMNEAHMVATELAVRTPARVVSVGYRLANERLHYPAPLDDVDAALQWVTAQFHATSAISIGGASAGASLATAAALRAVRAGRPVARLLLAYPYIHFPVPPLDPKDAADFAHELPAALRFTTETLQYFVRTYVGRLTAVPDLALPGHAELAGLPPTLVLTCQYDDLRPSGELLCTQLRESGVAVECHRLDRVPHGFLDHPPAVADVAWGLTLLARTLGETRVGPITSA